MLEVEERVRVLERGVVEPREVPDHVVREPERERDGGVGEQRDRARARDRRGERGRDPEHDEERRPLGEDDVLEQVHGEEVVHAERVDRRDADREEEHHRPEEAGDAPGGSGVAAEREEVRRGQAENDERLGVPRPRVRIHGATLIGRGRSSVGRAASLPSSEVTGSSPAARFSVRRAR